ncbi:MAG TPA: ABC transporter ATP-binding protein [Candidatus Dormibacteraeota bacterium]|nr:ABC transporter ATP-binding protein [Candidatus Dormibacteraeota bacterium]
MRRFAVRVLSYLPPYRQTLLWALVQVLLISALEMLKPWPLKIIIDSVLGGQPPPWGWPNGWSLQALLLAACAVLVLTYAALGALVVLNNYTTIGVGQQMVSKLRSDLYGHLHRLSLAFHSRAQVGDLIYRVTADTFALQSLTMNCLFPAVTALTLLVGMGVIMLRLDWKLTLVALGVCPALFVVIARLNGRITHLAGDVRRRESEVYAVVQQSMSMMRVTQAFTREDEEHRRFMDVSGQSLAAGLRLYTLQTVYSSVVNVIIALGTAGVVWVGSRHVMDGSLSIGTLVIFISYLASLYGPINSMFQTYGLAQGSRAAVQRVFDVLDVERDLKDSPREFPGKSARGEVAWENVSFGYAPGHPVLSGVTLRVRPGQKVAVVGPTGVGKSTLLSLLPRFYDPWAGRVLVDGVDAREYQLGALRQQIAMVLQPPLVFNASVHDNIAFGRSSARRDEIAAAARLAGIHETIMRLPDGYDSVVGEQGLTLSEGEKQRLTIARAILRDSPILILDEPTSALDSETEALIMQGLERLTAGRTTFVIAHRLATVRKADLIVVLRDGRIVEQGNFETLMEVPGAFASLYRLQAGVQEEDRLTFP